MGTWQSKTVWATLSAVIAMAPGVARARPGEAIVRQQVIQMPSGGDLRIDARDADLIVSSGGDKVVVVAQVASDDVESAKDAFQKMRFSVRTRRGGVTVRSGRWSDDRGRGLTIIVNVPTLFNVRADTQDGDIMVHNVVGTIQLYSGDGDVRVHDTKGERLKIRTKDGDIDLTGIATQSLSATTNDGDVAVRSVKAGTMRLRTRDGEINVSQTQGTPATIKLRGEKIRLVGQYIFEGKKLEGIMDGRINDGGPLIDALTADGEVSLIYH